jgi:CheY-like chemotaxis protein
MNHNAEMNRRNGLRCLIVEDNIQAAEIMTIFLERNGIVSETAENGQAGLRLYFGSPSEYDIIFIDLQMPVMDGYEMAKRIRESGVPKSDTIPLAAMSGTYTGDIAKKNGFNYFLKKPFEMRRLTEIIEEVKQLSQPV